MKNFILIHGLKGHGKTTLANIIEEELNNLVIPTKQLILADPIREKLSKAFDVSFDIFEHEDIKIKPHPDLFNQTPRKVMQLFGTEFAQECFGKDIWCRIAKNKANALSNIFRFFIIPDVRFIHEVDYFLEKAALTIFIRREGAGEEDSHISEQGLYHLYDENNPRMFFLDLPKESTISGTRIFVRNIIIDKILELTR